MSEQQHDFFADDRDTKAPTVHKLASEKNHDEELTNINLETAQPLATQEAATEQDKDRSFEQFWHRYPRKLDKKRARAVFARLTKGLTRDQLEALSAKIRANVQMRTRYDAQWLRSLATDKHSIPYAKSYLSGERWNDEWEPNLNGSPYENQWGDLQTFCAMGGTPEEFLTKK